MFNRFSTCLTDHFECIIYSDCEEPRMCRSTRVYVLWVSLLRSLFSRRLFYNLVQFGYRFWLVRFQWNNVLNDYQVSDCFMDVLLRSFRWAVTLCHSTDHLRYGPEWIICELLRQYDVPTNLQQERWWMSVMTVYNIVMTNTSNRQWMWSN